jgi:two-component system OmpR family response regulator
MATTGCAAAVPNEYAVMTIDRMLPRLDGLIVLRRPREDGIVCPALTLSALGGTDDRVQGLRAGYGDTS